MSYSKARENKFEAWWKKNHHKKTGQVWLCKSAKRIAFAYNLHPSAFDDIRIICKRFFSSEHMRLKKNDAWKMYKLCNPLYHERLKRLQTTAEHLDLMRRQSGDGLQHPLWIGKPKQKKSLSEFLSGKPDNKDVPSAQDILQAIKDRPRVEERRSKLPKLEYEDYVEQYGDGARIGNSHNTTLAKDVLERIDIVDLVHEAIFWGIDNHNAYGEDTKDVINCNSLSTFFRVLQELELSEPPVKENKDVV